MYTGSTRPATFFLMFSSTINQHSNVFEKIEARNNVKRGCSNHWRQRVRKRFGEATGLGVMGQCEAQFNGGGMRKRMREAGCIGGSRSAVLTLHNEYTNWNFSLPCVISTWPAWSVVRALHCSNNGRIQMASLPGGRWTRLRTRAVYPNLDVANFLRLEETPRPPVWLIHCT